MDQTREVRALDQVADLLTENHELRARIAELERDREMLVWLLSHGPLDVKLSLGEWVCVETREDIDAAMREGRGDD